jgi:hypothetical protein
MLLGVLVVRLFVQNGFAGQFFLFDVMGAVEREIHITCAQW